MKRVVLTPEKVTAQWFQPQLVIHATGHEDGITHIVIDQLANMLSPPEFEIAGEQTPAIGMFPYAVTRTFELATRPAEIVIVTPTGRERIPVT